MRALRAIRRAGAWLYLNEPAATYTAISAAAAAGARWGLNIDPHAAVELLAILLGVSSVATRQSVVSRASHAAALAAQPGPPSTWAPLGRNTLPVALPPPPPPPRPPGPYRRREGTYRDIPSEGPLSPADRYETDEGARRATGL